MKFQRKPPYHAILFYLILVGFSCLPVWTVEYFVNYDGSSHVYASYIMLELFKNNSLFAEVFAFNSISVPNSTGHWLLTFLLVFFSAFTATKIITTLTFAGVVAAVGWLRWKTSGPQGIRTSFLIGTILAFNWLWFAGFYNFMLGVMFYALTLGFYFGWRDNLSLPRLAVLSLLFLLTYFSHLIPFLFLAGTVLFLAFLTKNPAPSKNIPRLLLAFLPTVPLLLTYKSLTATGGDFSPVWRALDNPLSITSWLNQLRTVDSFVLISRKSFPFVPVDSAYFAVFAPMLWFFPGLLLLIFITYQNRHKPNFQTTKPFAILFFLSTLTALFAPDDFGTSHGSILRERIFICGMVLLIPFFQTSGWKCLLRTAQLIFLLIILFQTAVLWEYSLRTNPEARQYFAAKEFLGENESLASIVIVAEGWRYHNQPMMQFDAYLGIEKRSVVWSFYETGYYVFPIVAKNAEDKKIFLELSKYNFYTLNPAFMTDEKFAENLARLDTLLADNHPKIRNLLVWGKEPRIEAVISKYFDGTPVFENEKIRVFRQK